MELHISQTIGKIDYASFSVEFYSETARRPSCHGVLVTEYHKPAKDEGPPTQWEFRQQKAVNLEGPTPVGPVKVGHFIRETKETITDRWRLEAMTSSSSRAEDRLPRRIKWTVKESRGKARSSLPVWDLAVLVRHEGEPFLMRPYVSGRLQGARGIWIFRLPKFLVPTVRRVIPQRHDPEIDLSEAARKLVEDALPPSPSAELATGEQLEQLAPLTTELDHAFNQVDAVLRGPSPAGPDTRTTASSTMQSMLPTIQAMAEQQPTMPLLAPQPGALLASQPGTLPRPGHQPTAVPSAAPSS
ncbi:599578d2-c7de-41b2-8995-cd6fad4fa654 [Thermothielavioides terrestris]|nr:599578d2-c7de-41b2-8995-cd6fad4fa654 [Thermothielavioides terrestris]